jgi:PAS domain S-box-containing protein
VNLHPPGSNGLLQRERPVNLALLVLVVAASDWISIDLTRVAGSVSTVWIANGIVVGLLLFRPTRSWPVMLVAAFSAELGARLLHGDDATTSIAHCVANTLEIVLIAGAIRRRVPDITDPARLTPLALTATTSTLIACALSALLAASVGTLHAGTQSFGEVLLTWYMAHVVGMVVVATLVVVARREGTGLVGRPGRHLDFALCMGVLLATCAVVYLQHNVPLLFLLYPPLLLVTLRHGFAGVVSGVTVIAISSAIAAALQAGPFYLVAGDALLVRTLLLQLFVATSCLISLPLATVLTERKRLARQYRASETRYRTLADYSRDLVLRMSADGARSYVSPAVTDMLGWTPAEFMAARRDDLLHPDDIAPTMDAMRSVYAGGETDVVTCRVRHKHGHYVWIEAVATRMAPEYPGATPDLIASARDINRRMAALAALDESQARLRAVADNMPAFIAHVDADERYTFLNAYYSRLLGMPAERVLGKTVHDVLGDSAYVALAPYARRVGRTGAGLRTSPRCVQRRALPAIAFRPASLGGRHAAGLLRAFDRHHRAEGSRTRARSPGARGCADGARQSPPVRGTPGPGGRTCTPARHAPGADVAGPGQVQIDQRHLRTSGRRLGAARVRATVVDVRVRHRRDRAPGRRRIRRVGGRRHRPGDRRADRAEDPRRDGPAPPRRRHAAARGHEHRHRVCDQDRFGPRARRVGGQGLV